MNGEPTRRPGGGARLLFLTASLVGFYEILSRGFAPAARDRLPVLALAVLSALLAAWRPERGLIVFSFVAPLAGLGGRFFGGADAIAWPLLLFAGFACGWTFRFLYDFESAPDPSRADDVLRALTGVWLLGTLVAVVRARTLWALLRGLHLRAVNFEGLADAAAIRDSLMALATLVSGAGYFFILRRSGPRARRRALVAALAGTALSGAVAIGQRLGIAPRETSTFWALTGRLSGGAMDPNALGMLCGLGLVLSLSLLVLGCRRAVATVLTALLAGGLILSGSRSGILVAALGAAALLGGAAARKRIRPALAILAVALLAALGVVFLLRSSKGSVGSRISQAIDPGLPIEYRVSARPLLWHSAVRLFERNPVSGAGLGGFSWQLPNLLREQGRSLPMRDNPGNGYLQALAETGAVGFILTVLVAAALINARPPAAEDGGIRPLVAGSAAAVPAFFAALLTGSHWLAPDVAFLFFLLAAVSAPAPADDGRSGSSRLNRVLVGIYTVAVLLASLETLSAAEAFRYRSGIGFHGQETGAGGEFYWTERRFALRLLPRESIALTLAYFTPENRETELTAGSDGQTIFSRTLRPGEVLRLRLSGGASAPRVIRFSLSRAFVPKRLALSSDRRELGVVAIFPRR